MFDFLVPKAYAQFGQTVQNTADAAVEAGETGIQGLISYVTSNIGNWIGGLIIVVISYIISKMVAKGIKEAIIRERGESVQESALVLVERISKITIVGIGLTIALAINGLNFTAVIGALSLGIGFAMKDIIGNFISGVIMLSQDRIRIGDFIKVGEILGTIVSIDTRATILQAIDGTEVVIPNQSMLGETLISYSTNPFRRVEITVGVAYDTDLPMVTSLIKGIIDKDKQIVKKPEPMILVSEFGESSINLNIKFWIESGNSWLKIRSNLANKIKKAFDEVGVSIPFPIRTLKLDEDDRSFLKTMDSMKKGMVPEPKIVPSNQQIAQAAMNTQKLVPIPYSVFAEIGQNQATPAQDSTPKTTTPAPDVPQAAVTQTVDPSVQPSKATQTVSSQTEQPSTPTPVTEPDTEKRIAPPTHL